jgi:hypothetical protein
MAKYIEKAAAVEAITFNELVEFGKANGGNMVNGMPWSFIYEGHPVSHENDQCYLIGSPSGVSVKFTSDDMLVSAGSGMLQVCTKEAFASFQMVGHDQPLREEIDNGRLVISIGVDTLAFADKERTGYRVINPTLFAEDVVRALTVEEEDGATLVTKLLDDAMQAACDDGSLWIDTGKI